YLDVIPRSNDATKTNVVFQTSGEHSVYVLNTEFKYVKTTVNGTDWYLGTYGTNKTISASKTSYISDTSKIGVSQFCAWFATEGAGGSSEPEEPCKHTNTKVEGAKDATCTEAGHTGKTVCADCGETIDAGKEIPQLDHTYVDGKCECGAADPNYTPDEPEKPSNGVTMIDKVENLTAGTYKMGGYLVSYNNNGTITDWSANPYHLWNGKNPNSKDLGTTCYAFADGALTVAAGSTDNAAEITLIAVEGKKNTYYIMNSDGKYLTSGTKNRSLSFGSTKTEWVASNYSEGGILLTANVSGTTINLGTAGATKDVLRSYTSTQYTKYGVLFFAG
ncbi:MAG: WD40-like domain containing protein, partial [Oscillospiraceae bacterium]|nr:WD40-like domain containing protein [Oscillospiraceae bacterium]